MQNGVPNELNRRWKATLVVSNGVMELNAEKALSGHFVQEK
jgi:hypothetical protein